MSQLRPVIARRLAEGASQSQIASELGIANATVGYHARMLSKQAPSAPPPPPDGARSQVPTRERVATLLDEGLTKLEVARRLGISKGTVSYHARRLGIPVDERGARRYDWVAVQRYYDTGRTVSECVTAFGFSKETWHAARLRGDIVTRERRLTVDELCVDGIARNRFHLRRRLVEEGLKEERCEECGLNAWNELPMPLQLHHVNGVRDDNRIENLQILCPNCHALTDTWAGRNRAG